MADNRIAYGMLKKAGVVTEGMSPKEAWEKLKKLGLFNHKKNVISREEKKARRIQSRDPEHSPDYRYKHKNEHIAGVKVAEPMSFEQADSGNPNPYLNAKGLYGYKNNCQTCVVAFEARLRGYDVRALPNNKNKYILKLSHNTGLAYVTQTGTPPTVNDYIYTPYGVDPINHLQDVIQEGKRYSIRWTWANKPGKGHIICVSKEKGQLRFYDPQRNTIRNSEEFKKYISNRILNGFEILRVDNLEFNPKYIDYILKGTKK